MSHICTLSFLVTFLKVRGNRWHFNDVFNPNIYIQNAIVSTCNQYKKNFHTKFIKSVEYFTLTGQLN